MTGPSLKKLHAHHSIHEGSHVEGKGLTDLLIKLVADNRMDHAKECADALIEHWETRTIAHADAEEEGFYIEIVEEKPELTELITKFRRDHELVRMLVAELKERIPNEGITEDMLDKFKAIIVIIGIHSREEETHLFND